MIIIMPVLRIEVFDRKDKELAKVSEEFTEKSTI